MLGQLKTFTGWKLAPFLNQVKLVKVRLFRRYLGPVADTTKNYQLRQSPVIHPRKSTNSKKLEPLLPEILLFSNLRLLLSTDKVSSLQSSSGLFAIKYKLQFVDQLNFYLIISPQTEASSSFLKILILVRRLEGLSFPMGKTFWLFGEALFQEEAFNSPILANISCLI